MNTSRLATMILAAHVLVACPVSTESSGCVSHDDCGPEFECDFETGICYDPAHVACSEPGDCGANATCDATGHCRAGSCHFDDVGCVAGYHCDGSSGVWKCVSEDGGTGGQAGASGAAGESAP